MSISASESPHIDTPLQPFTYWVTRRRALMGMGQKSDSWEKNKELLPRRVSEPLLGEYSSMDSGEKKKTNQLETWAPGFDLREVVCYTASSGSVCLPIVLITSYLQWTHKLNSCLHSMCGPKTIVSHRCLWNMVLYSVGNSDWEPYKYWLCDVISTELHIYPCGAHPEMVTVQHTEVKYCFEMWNLCVCAESWASELNLITFMLHWLAISTSSVLREEREEKKY